MATMLTLERDDHDEYVRTYECMYNDSVDDDRGRGGGAEVGTYVRTYDAVEG